MDFKIQLCLGFGKKKRTQVMDLIMIENYMNFHTS